LAQYSIVCVATSNTTVNTDDGFVELKAPAAITVKVKRVRIGWGDGTATAGVDNMFRVKLMRWTTGSVTAGSAFTPVKRNATSVVAISTVKIKATTTAFALGTTTEIVDQIPINGRAIYEWIARDDDDMIVTKPGEYFAVVIASAVVSQAFTVTVDFLE
jgi:hypothetical protein